MPEESTETRPKKNKRRTAPPVLSADLESTSTRKINPVGHISQLAIQRVPFDTSPLISAPTQAKEFSAEDLIAEPPISRAELEAMAEEETVEANVVGPMISAPPPGEWSVDEDPAGGARDGD